MTEPDRSPDSPDQLFRLTRVAKTYHMGEFELEVLHHIDLEVYRGELLVVVGPSGSGKSTLLNLIGGIDTPTSGELWFENKNISSLNQPELTRYRRENVGFVFQFFNLIPTLTAYENVLAAAQLCSDPMDPTEALSIVGLADRMEHFPSQLSGGEQQRVSLARAVVKKPKLLLCDEPTGSLDLETSRSVLRFIDQLNRELGTTVVLITHNAAIAAIADRVIRIGSGTIAEVHVNESRLPAEEVTW